MATNLCFYFQVHQPWRLRHYRFLEVGKNHRYFDDEKNADIMRKVAAKCYLPMNTLLLDLVNEYKGDFKVSFSITGTALEQMNTYVPEVISSFRSLFETGHVELLSETSHHTLAALYSPEEFRRQVELHRDIATRLLIPPSKVFRNTELITNNAIARLVSSLGYEALLIEGADHVLHWRSPLFPYRMVGAPNLLCFPKNYRLSDDIAFRFSNRSWAEWPLIAEKYADWIKLIELENPVSARGGSPMVGLFMDYETFGEHQWKDTGIFDFMRALPGTILRSGHARFVTPSEAVKAVRSSGQVVGEIDAHEAFSWADIERDLSAWRGNAIQDAAFRAIYRLEPLIKQALQRFDGDLDMIGEMLESGSDHLVSVRETGIDLLETWRKLQTSDHFYYMCTKYFADGDVHKYFNPYDSPYDAHIIFMNVIADLEDRLKKFLAGRIETRAIA